jgi:hypothetical protein
MARRLTDGAERYGHVDAATDPRKWGDEAIAEALDGFAYVTWLLKKNRSFTQTRDTLPPPEGT